MRKLSKASLAVFLTSLKGFSNPKVSVEQYQTEPEIAADTLWKAYMAGDIEGEVIADLGCGPGIIGIGALILGAKKVYLIDSDQEALNIAKSNLDNAKSEGLFEGKATLLHQDISEFKERVDTVVQNPPFGVQVRHADREFLNKAIEIGDVIYTIHKSESHGFIEAFCRDNRAVIEGVWNHSMPLKSTMKFHTKRIHRINISVWKIRKMSSQPL